MPNENIYTTEEVREVKAFFASAIDMTFETEAELIVSVKVLMQHVPKLIATILYLEEGLRMNGNICFEDDSREEREVARNILSRQWTVPHGKQTLYTLPLFRSIDLPPEHTYRRVLASSGFPHGLPTV